MTDRLQLNFGNLPLVEAAIRISLTEPITLTFHRIQLLHEAIRPDYPRVTEPQVWEGAPGVAEQTISISPVPPIPGVVYEGHSKGLRLTVQSRVIVLRWIKQAQENAPGYPRYSTMREAVWDAFTRISETFKESPKIAAVNMSYVNFIEIGDSANILKDYFSEQVHIAATETASQIHQVELSWRDQAELDLRFRLQKVTAETSDKEAPIQGYQLTTIAGSKVPEGTFEQGNSDLDSVHDRLQHLFQDAISERAKKEWQLKVSDDG